MQTDQLMLGFKLQPPLGPVLHRFHRFQPDDLMNKHLGPFGMTVDASGNATKAVVAPRLKVSDVEGHSIMIHAGGDNYSDQPAPLGGGGSRIACGVSK